jgi:hypothetical protein
MALRRAGIHLIAHLCSGEFRPVYVCYKFGVKSFGLIQGFNGEDFVSRALVLRGTCTKTSRLPSTMSGHSGMDAATAARRRLAPAALVVVRWSKNLIVIFIMFELPCISCKLME